MDIIDRLQEELGKNNPSVTRLLLDRLLDMRNEWVTITTFAQGRIVFANECLLHTLNTPLEELLGKTVDELYVNPDQRRELLRLLAEYGRVENMEIEFRRHNGIGTYLVTAQSVDLLGEPCIVSVGWDITERRRLEEELHAALKNDLRQTVQALDNLVFRLALQEDGCLVFVMCEGKIARDMNITTEVVYGKTLPELFPPSVVEVEQPQFERVLQGGTASFELVIGERTLIKSLSPYYEQGKITGIVGSAIDITERKKLEKLLQASELNAVLGQLAAGAAHEIRNPLTAIKGFVQLIGEILKDNGIEKGPKYIDLILSELSRINHLVSEMLWLRKPKDTTYELLSVRTLWQEILPLVMVDANLKSIQVILEINSHAQRIKVDLALLKQVILNVCKNAVEAMDEGGILSVRDQYFKDHMTISIKDSGPGIPQEIKDEIFKPFFTTKSKGNGLGLFISRQIIQDMNGEIRVDSGPGGTTVTLKFPLHEAETMPEGSPGIR